MTKSIAQVHQAALAFRTQFRPLIEILDEVAELNDLENVRRELEGLVKTNRAEHELIITKITEANAEVKALNLRASAAKKTAEKQAQAVAEEIATARRIAAEEAERVRVDVSAEISRKQKEAEETLARVDETVAVRQKEVETLEVRLDLLRKAIAGIVVSSGE